MPDTFGDLISLDFGGGDFGDLSAATTPTPSTDPFGGGPEFGITTGPTGGSFGGVGAGTGAPGTEQAPPTTFDKLSGGVQAAGGFAKNLLPFLGLGTAGVGMAAGIQGAQTSAQQARIARQAQGMQKQTLQAQQAAAAPLTAFGSNELQQAQAGQIPPAIQAKIDAWSTGAKAKARDFAARSGQGDSTMLTQWESWIDQQAQAMAADYLQQQQQLGVQSLSQGAQALSGAGQNAASLQAGAAGQEAGIARLMDEANRALASLSAGAA